MFLCSSLLFKSCFALRLYFIVAISIFVVYVAFGQIMHAVAHTYIHTYKYNDTHKFNLQIKLNYFYATARQQHLEAAKNTTLRLSSFHSAPVVFQVPCLLPLPLFNECHKVCFVSVFVGVVLCFCSIFDGIFMKLWILNFTTFLILQLVRCAVVWWPDIWTANCCRPVLYWILWPLANCMRIFCVCFCV